VRLEYLLYRDVPPSVAFVTESYSDEVRHVIKSAGYEPGPLKYTLGESLDHRPWTTDHRPMTTAKFVLILGSWFLALGYEFSVRKKAIGRSGANRWKGAVRLMRKQIVP
jgi:hypothetical protein